jgi:hypothetical protein
MLIDKPFGIGYYSGVTLSWVLAAIGPLFGKNSRDQANQIYSNGLGVMREFSRLYTWIIIQHRVLDAARLRAILGLIRLPLSAVAALHVPHLVTAHRAVLKSLTVMKVLSHC